MEDAALAVRELTVELPESAPQVRITAGFGSAGQKTWNLRRPVTLIGSRRPAHIVLHDKDISAAHCVIVNTGAEVLVKDLHTSGGSYCNNHRIDIAVVKDGDTITIGTTHIQVAIRNPSAASADDSGCGLQYLDPTRFPLPLRLELMHTDKSWVIEEAVALIGRHAGAAIHLDHGDLSARHAILFRFQRQPAIFDLGGRTGIWVNGQRTSLTPLVDGDRITVGPFGLCIKYGGTTSKPMSIDAASKTDAPVNQPAISPQTPTPQTPPPSPSASTAQGKPDAPLEDQIARTWDSLNSWELRLKADATALGEQQHHLTVREAALDAREAALRGKLHDLERFHEQISAREKEVAELASSVQIKLDEIAGRLKAIEQREAELNRRAEELLRREHALTQRWTRLQSTTCAKCGERLNVGALVG